MVFLMRDGALVGELHVDLAQPVDLAVVVPTVRIPPQPPRPRPTDHELPYISVVVATTMSREAELDRCVDALLALDYPAYEIILVDNRPSSSPERARLHDRLRRGGRLRILAEQRRGISAARNLGARAARGEIVAFTDDDAVVDRGWLRAIGARFVAEPATGCVTGPVLPAELETPAQLWFERSGSKLPNRGVTTTFRGPTTVRGLRRRSFEVDVLVPGSPGTREFVYGAGSFGMGANLAWRRAVLAELGGFSEVLGTGTPAAGGEDIESLVRLLRRGGQVTFDNAAIVHHYHRADYDSSRQQMYAYGLGATAVMTALVVGDPRHVVGFGYLLAPALRVLTRRSGNRRTGGYPQELNRLESRGMLAGPIAYVRSRLAAGRSASRRSAAWSRDSAPVTS